jgi:hypothetical protein
MLRKVTGIFYFLNGLSMLIVWPVLIMTNQVKELNNQFIYMLFHLSSEFITAVLSIVCGIGLLKNRDWSIRIYFFSSGLSFSAGILAIIYYLFIPTTKELSMVGMLIVINFVLIFLLIKNFKLLYNGQQYFTSKLELLFNGAKVYVLINASGMLLDKVNGYTIGYASFIIILISYEICNSYILFNKFSSLQEFPPDD